MNKCTNCQYQIENNAIFNIDDADGEIYCEDCHDEMLYDSSLNKHSLLSLN